MKRIYLLLLAMTMLLPAIAQESKLRIAVFDPSSSGTSIDEGTKIAIREIISSTIVNIGKHDIVERSLLEKVMQEQKFSQSGVVDDTQMTEIGKLAGANKVIVSVVTLTGGRNMLSIKMIDVKTASVERQKVKVVKSGELIDVVESLTFELITGESSANYNVRNTEMQTEEEGSTVEPISEKGVDRNPKEGEIVLYLAPGYKPYLEEHKYETIKVYFDKEVIGSGTISDGFYFKIKDKLPGVHKIWMGCVLDNTIKINSTNKRFYEFTIEREKKDIPVEISWSGKVKKTETRYYYRVILKEAH